MHTWFHASSDLHSQTRGQRLHATPLRWLLIACASLIGALGALVMPATSLGAAGDTWTSQTSAANNIWNSVTYGNGLFVAVAATGDGNRVMTSPDGSTWTSQTSAANNNWRSVTYANGLFVAVAITGTGNRVMTSPNGSTWTIRTAAVNNDWRSVTYANGLFVAVAHSGTSNRVMTSPDGSTWTIRTSAEDNSWRSVTYGNGLFVAVSLDGTNNRVMTSPNGSTWTIRTSAADNDWNSVTYGNGLFVAVASSGTNNRVMTSGTLIPPTPATPVNTFTMKRSKGGAQRITTQLNLPGPGKVVQVGTTPLSPPRASSEMAKKARRMTVCTARKTVAKAGTVSITCRLTAKARAARKTHSLKVRLVTTFTPTGGTAKSLSKTLVLKKTR